MTAAGTGPEGSVGQAADGEELQQERPVVRDRRRIDPETGQLREPAPDAQQPDTEQPDAEQSTAEAATSGEASPQAGDQPAEEQPAGESALVEELRGDLQRLQAEYVNYRRRVDRDRDVAREAGVSGVLEALLPVLDDIHFAREHGDLGEGPFAAIADKLETALGRFNIERYGAVGEPFDPAVHEALMHSHSAEVTETTVVQVMQPGYRQGERIVRPARVAVADPE